MYLYFCTVCMKYLHTMQIRGVPTGPGRPSKTRLYSSGSDTPCGCSHHLSQLWHGILDTPVGKTGLILAKKLPYSSKQTSHLIVETIGYKCKHTKDLQAKSLLQPHWVQTLVFAAIQLEVSLSSSHFFIHFLNHCKKKGIGQHDHTFWRIIDTFSLSWSDPISSPLLQTPVPQLVQVIDPHSALL